MLPRQTQRVTAKVCLFFSQLSFSERNFYSVGDFGLATSALAAVDSSNLAPNGVALEHDMTLGVFCASYSPFSANPFFPIS
jgi:hypothetical protein